MSNLELLRHQNGEDPSRAASEVMPPGWPKMPWTPQRLARLKAAYLDRTQTVQNIALEFSTSHSQVCRMARENGWPRRFSAQSIANMTAVRKARR